MFTYCKGQTLQKKPRMMRVLSYIFDKENILNYKDSPIDQSKETFINLFTKRITIE